MLTISKAVPTGQAIEYYQREYASPGESYRASEISGEWHGRLAREWGLEGTVEREQYESLCRGQHPLTGEQLVQQAPIKRYYVNQYEKEITTSGHRAGWDLTFSAPKSVSLAAVAGEDERVREVHRESVDRALDEVERYTQARIGGNKPAETTERFIAAKFEHDAARPDKLMGYAAPQLHTHVLVFNVTETEDGGTRAVQPHELYRSQKYATSIYRAHLAEGLQRLGYEVEVDQRTGAPEIKGFSEEYLRESSPRSSEIRRESAAMKARLEMEGAEVKEGAGLRQAAARVDRESKEYDREEMRERVMEMEARHGFQAHQLFGQSIERGPLMRSQEEIARYAQEAVMMARNDLQESLEPVDVRQIWSQALQYGTAQTTYDALKMEMEERIAAGEFHGLMREQRVSIEGPGEERGMAQLPQSEAARDAASRSYQNEASAGIGSDAAMGTSASEVGAEETLEISMELG